MQQGPWLFRNMAVLFVPYDGFTKGEEVSIIYMPIWLRIHKLSDGYCRHALIVKLLRAAGEVLETRINGKSRGDYVRVRVKHDIRKPLAKFMSIVKDKTRNVFAVRYEKLARFCSACGIIGHEHKECGDGVFEEKDLKFGSYLYADHLVRGRSDRDDQLGQKAKQNPQGSSPIKSNEEQEARREHGNKASSPAKTPTDMELDKASRN
ncbi:hypothetical protein D1007_25230 [Hordeum vulgare]|nr:hypothetical protein D1007_25230 [Hordeum vulgare]